MLQALHVTSIACYKHCMLQALHVLGGVQMKETKFGSKSSKENYLKAILQLKKNTGTVRSIDIAEHMALSRPSVSRAMSELQKDGFIQMNEG